MHTKKFLFEDANRFIPYIALVGIGIGSANFIMSDRLNWIQWVIQSLSTSFIIGYATLLVGSNSHWFRLKFQSKGVLYLSVFTLFIITGIIATEIEHIIRSLIFRSESFQPFQSGKMYLINGLISMILGFSLFKNKWLFKSQRLRGSENQENPSEDSGITNDITISIPVRQGDSVLLIPKERIVYFEAWDNYSYVFDVNGNKRLCDYSLLFLEGRLEQPFTRVHRKYIVNTSYINQIRPHMNGRYVIEFSIPALPSITSSKSYSPAIRKLIKLQ